MEDLIVPIIAIPTLFIGLPWLIMHYITKWKTAPALTNDDESLLEELYQLARRLDSRMDTVERLVASANPDFQRAQLLPDREIDNVPREIEELRAAAKTKVSGRTAK